MTPDPLALSEIVSQRVSGFFVNARREPGITCGTCDGPVEDTRSNCSRCQHMVSSFPGQLADAAFQLAYAQRHHDLNHQSVHTMYAYKRNPRGQTAIENLQLMLMAAVTLHRGCMEEVVGTRWDTLTFVPSEQRPGVTHPIVELAKSISRVYPELGRVVLDIGPQIGADRGPEPRRFGLSERYKSAVESRHVVVLEDTWVTGGKAQSAAIALREAGASNVSILAVARYFDWAWDTHRAILESCNPGYSAFVCPTQPGICDSSLGYMRAHPDA